MGPRVNPSKNVKVTRFDPLLFKGPIFQQINKLKNRKIGPQGSQIFPGSKFTPIKTGKITGFGPQFFHKGPILTKLIIFPKQKKIFLDLKGAWPLFPLATPMCVLAKNGPEKMTSKGGAKKYIFASAIGTNTCQ